MVTEPEQQSEAPSAAPETIESKRKREKTDWNWMAFVFLPIGLTFFVLGLQDNTAYLAIGIVFMSFAAITYYTDEPQARSTDPLKGRGAPTGHSDPHPHSTPAASADARQADSATGASRESGNSGDPGSQNRE